MTDIIVPRETVKSKKPKSVVVFRGDGTIDTSAQTSANIIVVPNIDMKATKLNILANWRILFCAHLWLVLEFDCIRFCAEQVLSSTPRLAQAKVN